MKAEALALLISGSALTGEPIDSAGFYASRPAQLPAKVQNRLRRFPLVFHVEETLMQ